MKTFALVSTVSCVALGALGAHAQTPKPITLGQSLQGSITAESAKVDDGTPYDLYVYRGTPGERVRVAMNSSAFDAYLAVGTTAAPTCAGDCQTNDDGGTGTNAAVTTVVPTGGVLQIRANTIGADDSGAYTLSVSAPPVPAKITLRPIALNRATTGTLDERSPKDDSDLPFDLWTVKGRAGQSLVIRLNADELDPMVAFGQMSDGVFVAESSDDDSGPGSNARLSVTLGESGEGVVKASSYSADGGGSYTLTVGDPLPARPIVANEASLGESINGRLDDRDPITPDEEIPFDVYTIKGRPGQRIIARMESNDFDPILRWGSFDGEAFTQDASDDDSGGGTSAKLTVTLDEDGVGRLVATALEASTGNYTLSLVGAARPRR